MEKMRFPEEGKRILLFITIASPLTGIPEKAYAYVVNGKSAIEWVMERYQVTVHKESGIRNDPNDWHGSAATRHSGSVAQRHQPERTDGGSGRGLLR